MRPIKFRQFDSVSRTMMSGFGATFPSGWSGFPKVSWERYPIMQFTGLKDKNGKDIYEGDIISLSCGCCFYKVVWDEKKMCWWPVDDGFSQVRGLDGFDVWTHRIEVVGNVYENPEMAIRFEVVKE